MATHSNGRRLLAGPGQKRAQDQDNRRPRYISWYAAHNYTSKIRYDPCEYESLVL